jgi:putative ATPase
MARMTGSIIKELNATSSGSADVRNIFEEAKNLLRLTRKRTVLFVGELLSLFR